MWGKRQGWRISKHARVGVSVEYATVGVSGGYAMVGVSGEYGSVGVSEGYAGVCVRGQRIMPRRTITASGRCSDMSACKHLCM